MESTHREYDLGEGSGVIRSWVYEHAGIEMVVVPPSSLKKYATGHGNATKEHVAQYAVRSLGAPVPATETDATDASVLAHIAYALTAPSRPATRHAAEVLKTLRQPRRPKSRASRVSSTHNI